jgi:hypothetical protein
MLRLVALDDDCAQLPYGAIVENSTIARERWRELYDVP